MTTQEFIAVHREEDVRMLALKSPSGVDMHFALQQIDGWQRARTKLPVWAAHDGIVYPPHISMEQCSSEQTAVYKRDSICREPEEVKKKSRFIDLTGGFGVDFSYMSRGFGEAYYVERQEHLCETARHNFSVLGMDNAHVVCSTAESFLQTLPSSEELRAGTTIYLDPARRDTDGRKTYAIADCTPDVVALMPVLRQKARRVIVKLSPMLDHREACRLTGGVSEVHIVSVKNECKELVLVVEDSEDSARLVCVNDGDVFETMFSPCTGVQSALPPVVTAMPSAGDTLVVPNASMMKAGCFAEFAARFGVAALDRMSHLFIAKNVGFTAEIPGRKFEILAVSSLNRKELRRTLGEILGGLSRANIAVRNFPLSAEELRKRLRLKDGGETYVFGTTILGVHRLVICRRSRGEGSVFVNS
ncbi:MAG: class I SAM-dependent methyltransferase [Bacteroidales bacterium]|nr:class I SAM-dependent methyltransferase [Bacteroidales bacterium]MCM1146845.1 class I SAM-dependent methyltransferase [Bacteroidales bacterium]MCM1205657.1 class I SAM-dependent methyltransferase [Bacillota bacterium]MCM1510231.1 class I SAM-dependent methyltransferase [Clostridium sp.]